MAGPYASFASPEYIIAAGKAGLGEWDPEKIQLKKLTV